MKEKLARLVYKYCKTEIHDIMLEDFFGMVPPALREPSMDFLALHREKLERFFTIQAYKMQRRSIMDEKNAQEYRGILIHIKSVLMLIQSGKKETVTPTEEVVRPDPMKNVSDFIKEGKKRIKKLNPVTT